jgi:hypothetical protein
MALPRVISPYGPSAAFPRFVSPYGLGAPSRWRRRRNLLGLGADVLIPASPIRACPAWGCNGPEPVRIGPITFGGGAPCQPGAAVPNATWDQASCQWIPNTASTGAPSTAASQSSVAGTPVPVGFPTNQIFVNTDGSQWVYSAAQGTWVDVGVPYNLSAASPPPSASTSTPPAPAVGATYTDSNGNVWTFNGTQWSMTGSTATTTAGVTTGFPANAVAGATYTDSSGNLWTYNGTQWTLTTPASSSAAAQAAAAAAAGAAPYNSLINFITEDSLITGIPNWGVGVGLYLAYLLISSKLGGKR